uniref:BED-type domain-containing protein n=1 Tax=Meloidogyne hapla TaxID=6305 RepID=A0A1I8BZJ7_MELHA
MLKKYNDWIQSCRIYNKYNYITVDDEGKNFICEACKLVKTKQFIGNVIKFEFVNNRAKERINEHLATDYHATSISSPEATKEDNIIRQLKRISGWIAKDKDNVKYKYITLDDDGKNFICEACKFVNENFNGKDIKFEFDAYDKNRNTKSSIYNHLTTNKGHAAVIKSK